jgi:hypothetical protein
MIIISSVLQLRVRIVQKPAVPKLYDYYCGLKPDYLRYI